MHGFFSVAGRLFVLDYHSKYCSVWNCSSLGHSSWCSGRILGIKKNLNGLGGIKPHPLAYSTK